MSESENLQISRQIWDAWNAHDPAAYLKFLDANYVIESDTIPEPIRGPGAAQALRDTAGRGWSQQAPWRRPSVTVAGGNYLSSTTR